MSLLQDLRYALRGLRRTPAFTAVAVTTLALGIGATTAIFGLLDAVLMKPLPVRNPEQLALVAGAAHYPAFQAFQRHSEIFIDLAASSGVRRLDVEIDGAAREPTEVSLVSGSYFSTLGVAAAVGRTFSMNDDRVPGGHPVAVASYGYWQRRFGRDPSVLGKSVRVGATSITIIGVTPPGFFGEHVGAAPDLWLPLTMWGHLVPGRNLLESGGTGWLQIIGRIHPGVSLARVNPALTHTFQSVLTEVFGPVVPEDLRRDIANSTVMLIPAATGVSNLRGRFGQPLQLLMGAVVLVLLIACANVANLLLARAAARRREIDVRLALGMSRARLVRQLLTESLTLAAIGGTAGLGLAWLCREGLLRLISADGSRLPIPAATDVRVLGFAAGVSIATAVLFGLAPMWQSTRATVVTSLGARRALGEPPRQRLGSLLIVAQVAVSLVLLTGAGLFLRTLANLREVDLGFAIERLMVIDVNPHTTGYRGEKASELHRRILERISGVDGVRTASFSEHGVLAGEDNSTNLIRPEGFAAESNGYPRSWWDVVGPEYFSTLGIPLLMGRDFTERDHTSSVLVVAINEEMARRFFGDTNPIGRRLVWGDGRTSLEVIAVARDVKQSGPRDEPQLRFYLPYFQMPAIRPGWVVATTRFLVRSTADPAALAPILRQMIPSEDPRLSVASVSTGPELVSRTLVQERMIAVLLTAFGALAIGLACVGLYGLIGYQVVQRTGEMGIRLALGATRVHVLWSTLRRSLAWTAAGIVMGVPLALSISRFAESHLFGVSATDATTLVGAAVALFAMGLAAGYVPARRAARVDPLVALRYE